MRHSPQAITYENFSLDLIAANHVFLVEPQWNPSVELQAIGRTMRIGQRRKVTVTRYIVLQTVEKVRVVRVVLRSLLTCAPGHETIAETQAWDGRLHESGFKHGKQCRCQRGRFQGTILLVVVESAQQEEQRILNEPVYHGKRLSYQSL